ncbi:MAG: hypothetical protein IKQ94_06295 [Bacteroidales bacterium]|nr:hypothetical protein [Bacteroidales bacterium]
MKNTLWKILRLLSSPLALLAYLTAIMLFSSDFRFLPKEIFVNIAKNLAIVQLLIPLFAYLIAVHFQKRAHRDNNILLVAEFAIYFAMVSFFGHTVFKSLSIMQQLPMFLTFAALVMEWRRKLDFHIFYLTAFITTLIIISLIYRANLIIPIVVSVIAQGALSYLYLEEETSSVRTLLVNFFLGIGITLLFFIYFLFTI